MKKRHLIICLLKILRLICRSIEKNFKFRFFSSVSINLLPDKICRDHERYQSINPSFLLPFYDQRIRTGQCFAQKALVKLMIGAVMAVHRYRDPYRQYTMNVSTF